MMKKRILITGGSGFIGSHLADILSEQGYKVIIYDIKKSNYLKYDQKFILGDLSDKKQLIKQLKEIHAVFHFASIADIFEANTNIDQTLKTNILYTNNLLEACVKNKIKQFILASSVYVYSKYGGVYKITKQTSEALVEHYSERFNLNFTILRFGSLYGTRANEFNWISKLIKNALSKKIIDRNGTGDELREYINVKDAAIFTSKIISKKYYKKYLMLTGNHAVKVKDLLKIINEIFEDRKSVV